MTQVILTDADQIPFGAFCNCEHLTDITINEGVKTISAYSFYNCTGLKSLVVPDSVESISEKSLYGCVNIEEISLPFVGASRDANGTYDGALGFIFGRTSQADSNYYVQYSMLNGSSLSGYGYAVPDALTHVSITDAAHIPVGAFCNLVNLKAVTLNGGIDSINEYAFYKCNGLKDVYYRDWDINWEQVEKRSGNDVLNSVTIHFLETLSKLCGYSLTLEGKIGVDFYLELKPGLINSNPFIRFNYNGVQTDMSITKKKKKIVNGKTVYKFTYPVAAKEMTSDIKTQIISGDKQDVEYTYSVRDYAEYILTHTNIEEYAQAAPLVEAMLNYGAAAQTYFGYNTDSLAFTGKLDNEVEIPDNLTVDNFADTDFSAYGLKYYGAALRLESKVSYMIVFEKTTGYNAGSTTVKLGEAALTPSERGDYVIYEVPNICAGHLTDDITLTFNEKSFTFHPTTYFALAKNQTTGIETLVKALYNYDLRAKNYSN